MQALFSILGIWGYSQISSSTIFPDKTPDLNSYHITSIQTSLFFTGEIKNEKFENEIIFVVFSEVRGIKKWKIDRTAIFSSNNKLPETYLKDDYNFLLHIWFISKLFGLNLLVDDCHFFYISYGQSLFSLPNCFLKTALIPAYIQYTRYSLYSLEIRWRTLLGQLSMYLHL
jgi:hypothetical protein